MFLPKKLQAYFEKSQLYLYIRYKTPVYKLWLLIRSDVKKQMEAKSRFYRKLFSENCKLIIDIGANEGMLTHLFSQLSQRVIAVEPSARNLEILRVKFSGIKNVIILPVAVSNTNGEQLWYEDVTNFAMGTLSRKWNDIKPGRTQSTLSTTFIKTVTLDALLQRFGVPDYIKIDVEGNELQVLSGLSKRVPLLSFEAILPAFMEETLQCIETLAAITKTTFNYTFKDGFVYPEYQSKEQLTEDVRLLNDTIDIFCKMD